MSILGYSTSYFLPEYWASTPLYGEKIIPLLDYMLSTEYEESEKLAQAYYNITNKYKNPADLPISVVEELIDESGYSYIKDLLGGNETSLRLLLDLMVLIHQLKGTKLGIQVVLSLLRKDNQVIIMQSVGSPRIDSNKNASGFTDRDYIVFQGFNSTLGINGSLEIKLKIGGFKLGEEQCIASVSNHRVYIGMNANGHLILSLGNDWGPNVGTWNIVDGITSSRALPAGTECYIRLIHDGYEYSLQVSKDDVTYETWITVEAEEGIDANYETLYLGIDGAAGVPRLPFTGYINFSDLSVTADNIEIEQWFEQTPVEEENTFIIKSDLDVTLVSTEFFMNFANFIRHYVYPTLKKFIAGLRFDSQITFLPYVRHKIRYVAYGDVDYTSKFYVKPYTSSSEATDLFEVLDEYGNYLDYEVVDTLVVLEPYLIKENEQSEEATDNLLVVGVLLDEDYNVIKRIEE